MRELKTKVAAVALSSAIAIGALAAPVAFAGGNGSGCNSGRGNGSEGCDPGNSSTALDGTAGQNQGGDEGGPIQGGTGAP